MAKRVEQRQDRTPGVATRDPAARPDRGPDGIHVADEGVDGEGTTRAGPPAATLVPAVDCRIRLELDRERLQVVP